MKINGLKKSIIPLSILMLACVTFTTSLTVAKFISNANVMSNSFNPADSIDPTVYKTVENGEIKDVYVNVGNTKYPVYVRAVIVFTWVNDSDTYYVKPIVDVDYQIMLNASDWRYESDGFYYHQSKVESGKNTNVLIRSCKQLETANVPDGYRLSVEVITETVQAVGTTDEDDIDAWEDAWK